MRFIEATVDTFTQRNLRLLVTTWVLHSRVQVYLVALANLLLLKFIRRRIGGVPVAVFLRCAVDLILAVEGLHIKPEICQGDRLRLLARMRRRCLGLVVSVIIYLGPSGL